VIRASPDGSEHARLPPVQPGDEDLGVLCVVRHRGLHWCCGMFDFAYGSSDNFAVGMDG